MAYCIVSISQYFSSVLLLVAGIVGNRHNWMAAEIAIGDVNKVHCRQTGWGNYCHCTWLIRRLTWLL